MEFVTCTTVTALVLGLLHQVNKSSLDPMRNLQRDAFQPIGKTQRDLLDAELTTVLELLALKDLQERKQVATLILPVLGLIHKDWDHR